MQKVAPLGRDGRGFQVHTWATSGDHVRALDRIQPHMRPDSIFLAAIGTMWEPKSWAHVVDMFTYTRRQGFGCWFEEMVDSVTDVAGDAVTAMQNRAVTRARIVGAEYVCLIDNDVLPEPDTLVKLIKGGAPITIPYIHDYENGYTLMHPTFPPDSGLRWLRWSVLSFMLFRVNALTGLGLHPFSNGSGEGDFFDQLWVYGHAPVVDTHTEVKLARYPSRPGSKTPAELAEWRLTREIKRKETQDRRPIDPDDKRVLDGVYCPWMFPEEGDAVPSRPVDGRVEVGV